MNKKLAAGRLEAERLRLRKLEMDAFDSLPAPMRRALAASEYDWRATEIARAHAIGAYRSLADFKAGLRLADREQAKAWRAEVAKGAGIKPRSRA